MIERREFTKGLAATALIAAAGPAAAAPREDFEMDLIMPDIRFVEHVRETVRDNTITLHYTYMTRWRSKSDAELTVECAKVGSKRYAQWLAERTNPKPYPPHFGFGGAVVANPKGDPGFYDRWVAYASTLA
jgi:hypothetical protein